MFDSNVFAEIVSGKIDLEIIKGTHQYCVTHIQEDEINQCRHPERKKELLEVFNKISPYKIPTTGAVWGISNWGECTWADEEDLIEEIAENLPKKGRKTERADKENRLRDALIANTCIREGYILVSSDLYLSAQVQKYGGESINVKDFIRLCEIKSNLPSC